MKSFPKILGHQQIGLLRLIVLCLTLALSMMASAQLATSAWPKFRGNAANTGVGVAAGANGTLQWATAIPQALYSSPAIGADGTVYIGANTNVYALNPATGALKWGFATSSLVFASPVVGSDGTVYVGSEDHKFYAINGADGTKKWAFDTGGIIVSSAAIAPDGTIYVGDWEGPSTNGHLYALNPDGTVKWTRAVLEEVSSPAVGPDGTIYFGSPDNNIYAINPDNSLKWQFSTGGHVESAPAIDSNGNVYVNGDDGFVYSLNGATGTLNWKYNTNYTIAYTPSIVSSPAIGADGTIFVGSYNKTFYAINSADGTLKWSKSYAHSIESSPAIGADGTVYLGPADGNIYAYDPQTGNLKWNYASGTATSSSPAIGSDGSLYVGAGSAVISIQSVHGAGLTLNPTAINGGLSSTGTVSIDNSAPSGGIVVTLSSNNSAASVPQSVTIAAGSKSAFFTITTTGVDSQVMAKISAKINGQSQNATLTINPATLSGFSFNPSEVIGGNITNGTITLSGQAGPNGLKVGLTLIAGPPAVVNLPATVLVLPGASSLTFRLPTNIVQTSTYFTVRAEVDYLSGGVTTQTAQLVVSPLKVQSFTLNPSSVIVGGSYTGTVTLNGPAPDSTKITISSTKPAANAPNSVTVQKGSSTGSFTATSGSNGKIGGNYTATITAKLGNSSASATLTVEPISVVSVTFDPSTVAGGTGSTGTVTLNGPAPAGGSSVTLKSSSASATVSGSVTVPAGSKSANFPIKTTAVKSDTAVKISATLISSTQSGTLTVSAPTLTDFSFATADDDGGTPENGTIRLSSIAPIGGIDIQISGGDIYVTAPRKITVPAGKNYVAFTMPTRGVSIDDEEDFKALFNRINKLSHFTIRATKLRRFVLNPSSVVGGSSSTGTIYLTGFAPKGGVIVSLTSTASASVKSSVVVPEGQTSATFKVSTSKVTVTTIATIMAKGQYGGSDSELLKIKVK